METPGNKNSASPIKQNSPDEEIAQQAWNAIEHGLRFEGVSVGPEIILAALRKSKAGQVEEERKL